MLHKYTIELELHTNRMLYVWLYRNVENSGELLEAIKSGILKDCSVLNAEMVAGEKQLEQAAILALHREKLKNMRSRNVHTEILVICAGVRNVKDALDYFSIDAQTKDILFASIQPPSDFEEKLNRMVKGENVEFSELSKSTSEKKLREYYDITEKELDLEEAILPRVAMGAVV